MCLTVEVQPHRENVWAAMYIAAVQLLGGCEAYACVLRQMPGTFSREVDVLRLDN